MHPKTALVAGSVIFSVGCGGYSSMPAAPTAASARPTTSASNPSATFSVQFSPARGAAFTAQVDGSGPIYSDSGSFILSLPNGTHTIVGTYAGAGLEIAFSSVDNDPGVEAGSLRNLRGIARLSACSNAYEVAQSPTAFGMEFEVNSFDRGANCRVVSR